MLPALRSRLVKKAGLLLEEYHNIQARFGALNIFVPALLKPAASELRLLD